jgi:hypothetical protein
MATLSIAPAILLPTAFLANSAALLFQVTSGNGAIIKKASFANVTAGNASIILYRLPSGIGSVATQYIITGSPTVVFNSAPYTAVELTNMVLMNGDSIWGVASAASTITGTMSGFTF